MPKVKITKRYYKRSLKGREPIRYMARERNGEVHATIRMDPILRKHPDLRKAMLTHEKKEITAWAKGSTSPHKTAKVHEPKKLRKIGGVSGFWKEIKRREEA